MSLLFRTNKVSAVAVSIPPDSKKLEGIGVSNNGRVEAINPTGKLILQSEEKVIKITKNKPLIRSVAINIRSSIKRLTSKEKSISGDKNLGSFRKK